MVRFPLIRIPDYFRFNLRNTWISLLLLFGHPLPSCQQHLFFLKFFIDLIKFIYLLLSPLALHIETALEIFTLVFLVLDSFFRVISLIEVLFRLIHGQLWKNPLCFFEVRLNFNFLPHVKRSSHFQQILRHFLVVFSDGRCSLI